MGFMDKLREAKNTAGKFINDKLEEITKNSSSKYDPEASARELLSDETVKNYFENICDMEWSISKAGGLSTETTLTKNIELVKTYIEHFYGKICDEEKFQTAFDTYIRTKNINAKTDSKEWLLECAIAGLVTSRQKEFTESLEKDDEFKSSATLQRIRNTKRFQAYRVLFADDIAAATTEYQKVLDVIKDNVNRNHYSQGLEKISFSNDIIKNEGIKDELIDIIEIEYFLNNNPITQEMIFHSTEYGMFFNMNWKNRDYRCYISMLILRALHFEKHGHVGRENYISISNDDIRNYVLNVDYFKNKINDHPFDIDKYIGYAIEEIKPCDVVMHYEPDEYFSDAVCNMMWKRIAKSRNWSKDVKIISDSKDLNDIFDIICTYFQQQYNS